MEILTSVGMINPRDKDMRILKLIKYGEWEYIHDKDNMFNKTLNKISFTIA